MRFLSPRLLITVLTGVLLCAFWYSRITGSPVQSDPLATLQMGVNLAHHGVMSIDEQAPYAPTMYREPAPALVIAGMVKVIDAFAGEAPLDDYVSGERARWLKLQNIAWFLLLCVSLQLAVRQLRGSWPVGMVAAVVGQAFFFYPGMRSFGVDTLFSDIQAAGVMAMGSWLVIRALDRRSFASAVLAGAVFGVLALIKAAMFYVAIGFVLFLVAMALLPQLRNERRDWLRTLGAFLVALLVVTVPWMLRNQQQFGVTTIADRAGLSLYTRMLKDGMTAAEYRGSFYVWSPGVIRPFVGRALGYSQADLRPGGRLERLYRSRSGTAEYEAERAAERAGDPDAAKAFYYKGRAERERRTQAAARQGAPFPGLVADQSMQQDALHQILRKPVGHLALALPYLWRGALLSFPLLLVALTLALLWREHRLLWYVLPSFGMVVFYALLANFEERYGTPAIPVAIAAFLIVVLDWRSRRARRL